MKNAIIPAATICKSQVIEGGNYDCAEQTTSSEHYTGGKIYHIFFGYKIGRVAMVREKSLENDFFSRSGNFEICRENLEKMEKSGKSLGISKFPFKWYG